VLIWFDPAPEGSRQPLFLRRARAAGRGQQQS
jgi:hypothetical protein